MREGFDFKNRFELKTEIGNYLISTVDLGFNHQFLKDAPPLYFETMIFNLKDEKNIFKDYQERYISEQGARIGHKEAVLYVKVVLGEEDEII